MDVVFFGSENLEGLIVGIKPAGGFWRVERKGGDLQFELRRSLRIWPLGGYGNWCESKVRGGGDEGKQSKVIWGWDGGGGKCWVVLRRIRI